jgi:hypothetical protein
MPPVPFFDMRARNIVDVLSDYFPGLSEIKNASNAFKNFNEGNRKRKSG